MSGQSLIRNIAATLVAAALAIPAHAAQIANDAKAAIPHDLQQLIVVDYRAMQNSNSAMALRARVLPPELKRFETAITNSGMSVSQDVEQLAFASFRPAGSGGETTRTVGIAQGQFQVGTINANFKKQKLKPTVLRSYSMYPMGASGFQVVFLNPTTMLFGDQSGVKAALDARDGLQASMLTNNTMTDLIPSVENSAVWSILDQKGTQFMMRSVLGDASQLTDYETVKKRLLSSRYTLDFEHGVKFNLDVLTPDTFTAATMSSLLNAAALYRKTTTSAPAEKQIIDETNVTSSGGTLQVRFASSDADFASLLKSDLFTAVVR